MRLFLISVVIICYVGGIISIVVFSVHHDSIAKHIIGTFLFILLINILSARYLYAKAPTHKLEWALFGLIGNINAIFFHWLWRRIFSHWMRGRGLFDPE
jgi:uncharacterized membrane protein